MSKQITLSSSCKEPCASKHTWADQHQTMDINKFKYKFNEFLYLDDDHWLPAFSVQDRLDELVTAINRIKEQFGLKIVEKRLKYALNFDTSPHLLKIFRLANQDSFKDLRCEDISDIMKKIQQKRQPKPAEIRALISSLMKEQRTKLLEKINQSFSLFQDIEKQQEVLPKYSLSTKQQQPIQWREVMHRQLKQSQRQKQDRKNASNDLPTIKVKQISNEQGYFNIALKVIKVKKEFSLGEHRKKVEVECGDQTGLAIAVVDSRSFVKTGAVIMINNAKVYQFHGIKQIQQQQRYSVIEELKKDIKISFKFNFSEGNKTRNYYVRDQERSRSRSRSQSKEDRSTDETQRERIRQKQKEGRKQQSCTSTFPFINGKQPILKRNNPKDEWCQATTQEDRTEQANNRNYRPQKQENKRETKNIEQNKLTQNQLQLTKIRDINPEMIQGQISMIAQVCSITNRAKVAQDSLSVILGDQTGTIWAQLSKDPSIRVNAVLRLKGVEVCLHQTEERLMVRQVVDSQIQKISLRIKSLNMDNDVSSQIWKEAEDEEEEEQEENQVVQDF